MRVGWRLLAGLAIAAACGSTPALADFTSAMAAYEARQYESAFEQFRTLAQIGHPPSQYNLGVLYLRGEGTTASRDLAFGWLTLAAEAGNPDAAAALAKALRAPTAAQLAAAEGLKNEFGHVALARKLLPDPKCQPFDTPPAARRVKSAEFPPAAERKKLPQAFVIVEFYVAADGRAREPRILQSTPAGLFDDSVLRSVVGSEYVPATRDGQKVGQWTRFAYTFSQRAGQDHLRPFLNDVRDRASAGDPANQYLYSLILMSPGLATPGAPTLDDMAKARVWRLMAAQGGLPHAQYMIGRDQLATACTGSVARAMEWIRLAANNELPEAQVLLSQAIEAQILGDPQPRKTALDLLERAARTRDLPALRSLAETLSVSSLRDGSRALALGEELVKRQPYYPTVFELRAAAHAALGQFEDAVSDQRRAIKLASRLDWNVEPLKRRLEAYLARQAWSGPILLPDDRSTKS